MQIELAIPDVAMLFTQPPMSGSSVRQALVSSSESLVSGATVCCDSTFAPEIVFVVGDTQFEGNHVSCWRLTGSDWWGALAMDRTTGVDAWTSEWPVGSMISAALAANEAFKFVMRRLPLRGQADRVFFEESQSCNWDFGAVHVPEEGVDLGMVDVISAGAICQAALYALMRFPNVRMSGRIFDDDLTGASNLNRNMLSSVADIGLLKVQVVARCCSAKLRLKPIAVRFPGDSCKIGQLARRVLVGVDDIPSRWEVQRHAPGWIAVSGTSHFGVSSSAHRPDEPCCGCLHPVDDPVGANPIPTVSFVSFWAGLAMTVRLLRDALASSYSANRQHLWLTPLRMDLPHAGMWLPVAPRRDCPAHCLASRVL
ncbi:MAG: hypothetical protein LAN18_03665 [Acidobacteriia bacterium]|nr:hypothetical protein [Terriglobia bacterium]